MMSFALMFSPQVNEIHPHDKGKTCLPLYFFDLSGDKHVEKISNCSSTPKLVQADDSAVSLRFFNFSHDCTMPSARNFATVLRDTCRPYVLQMRRNELMYGFYCQNPLVFVEYIFQFFINKALPGDEFHRHQIN